MLLAALVAVTSFAQDVKQRQIAPSQMVTKTLQATPSIKPFQAISKAQVAKTTALKAKKAPKKAGLSDVEWPLTATIWWNARFLTRQQKPPLTWLICPQ